MDIAYVRAPLDDADAALAEIETLVLGPAWDEMNKAQMEEVEKQRSKFLLLRPAYSLFKRFCKPSWRKNNPPANVFDPTITQHAYLFDKLVHLSEFQMVYTLKIGDRVWTYYGNTRAKLIQWLIDFIHDTLFPPFNPKDGSDWNKPDDSEEIGYYL